MFSDTLKKKKVLLLLGGIVFIAVLSVAISLLARESKYSDADFDPKSISKIHIRIPNPVNENDTPSIYSSDQFVIAKEENIEKVIGYVKKMVDTELKSNAFGIYPAQYEFTYYFKNGKVKSYTHNFLAVTSDEGFETIFTLEEVIPQINYVFTTKDEDVKDITLFAWKSENDDGPLTYSITEKEQIDYILQFGQENMLYNYKNAKTKKLCGVEFTAFDGSVLFIVFISPDMYKFDELCEKVPKVKEFAELAGDN